MESKIYNQTLIQPFNLLGYSFVNKPIMAGVDKFVNLLTHCNQNNNPSVSGLLSFSGATFIMILGVIEIVACIFVLKNPEIGGSTVAVGLTLIALTLLLGFKYIKVANRDLTLVIAAFSMSRKSKTIE